MCMRINGRIWLLFYLNIKRMRPLLLIGMLCCLTLGCTTTQHTLLAEEPDVRAYEKRLWLQAEQSEAILEASDIIYEDQALEHYFQQIVEKIAPPDAKKKFTFRIRVIKDPSLNAFAFPNGVIYIHTGLLARLDNEAQLAALLAHEIAHCTQQHSLRVIKWPENPSTTLASLRPELTRYGQVGNFLALFDETNAMAAVSGYYQSLETEADSEGLELISKAGYEPTEALRLFEHLEHELGAENINDNFPLDTNLWLNKRIENCKNFLNNLKYDHSKKIKNQLIFLKKIKQVIMDNAFLDLKAGRYRTAQGGAEKYLMIAKDDPALYFLLGEIARQKGGKEANRTAKTFYEKAISMDPSYPDPHKAIGLIYYKERQWALAKRSFESLLSLSPYLPDRSYINTYLKECNDKESEP